MRCVPVSGRGAESKELSPVEMSLPWLPGRKGRSQSFAVPAGAFPWIMGFSRVINTWRGCPSSPQVPAAAGLCLGEQLFMDL